MNSKQRAYLRKLSATIDPIFQIGKSSVTPELTAAVDEALEARELIKITVLKNCFDDCRALAETLADRTNADVVHVIGRKIVLYRPARLNNPPKMVHRSTRIWWKSRNAT